MTIATVKIPYYAADIPMPIPTEEEIEAATDVSTAHTGRRIVEINAHFVVKFGEGVELAEGMNMIFVRQNTSVPVPEVYALYSKRDKNYIVMQRVAGQTLSALWPQLNFVERETISSTLRVHFDEMRALKSPRYYGSLGKHRLLDGIFWAEEPDVTINGPFESESVLIEALARKYTYDGLSRYKAEFYRQCLPHVSKGFNSTFTHGDFHRKNILVHRLVGEVTDSQT